MASQSTHGLQLKARIISITTCITPIMTLGIWVHTFWTRRKALMVVSWGQLVPCMGREVMVQLMTCWDYIMTSRWVFVTIFNPFNVFNDFNYDIYNRRHFFQPNGNDASSTYAHAKGILVASVSSSSGYWLVHSMPQWPEYVDDAHDFPGPFPSDTYAQSLRCVR